VIYAAIGLVCGLLIAGLLFLWWLSHLRFKP